MLANPLILLVPRAGIEPARGQAPRDFKSLASTNSATQAPISNGEKIKFQVFHST